MSMPRSPASYAADLAAELLQNALVQLAALPAMPQADTVRTAIEAAIVAVTQLASSQLSASDHFDCLDSATSALAKTLDSVTQAGDDASLEAAALTKVRRSVDAAHRALSTTRHATNEAAVAHQGARQPHAVGTPSIGFRASVVQPQLSTFERPPLESHVRMAELPSDGEPLPPPPGLPLTADGDANLAARDDIKALQVLGGPSRAMSLDIAPISRPGFAFVTSSRMDALKSI